MIAERAGAILKLEGPYSPDSTVADIPVDLLTASASGLDPHISVAAARVPGTPDRRGAGSFARAGPALIDEHTEGPALGFLGQERVNVLELNLALEQAA